jgi:hypothetical protein
MIVFPDMKAYRTFAPGGSVGVFWPSMSHNRLLATLSTGRAGMTTMDVIQHEYVHFLLFSHGTFIYPPWYNEGYSEFLGATRVRASDVEIGRTTSHGPPVLEFWGRDVWTPVSSLLSFGVGGHAEEDVMQRYPQSWALVHYLYFGRQGKPKGPRQVARYLRLVAKGSSVADAVQDAFGVDVDTLDEELQAYVEKGHYPGAVVKLDRFPPAPARRSLRSHVLG